MFAVVTDDGALLGGILLGARPLGDPLSDQLLPGRLLGGLLLPVDLLGEGKPVRLLPQPPG